MLILILSGEVLAQNLGDRISRAFSTSTVYASANNSNGSADQSGRTSLLSRAANIAKPFETEARLILGQNNNGSGGTGENSKSSVETSQFSPLHDPGVIRSQITEPLSLSNETTLLQSKPASSGTSSSFDKTMRSYKTRHFSGMSMRRWR